MTTLRSAAQQALQALRAMNPYPASKEDQRASALAALRAALVQQAEPDHETRAELAEQQVVQLAEERDHYRNLWQKAQQDEPVEPVAWMFESERNFNLVGYGGWEKRITECRPNALQSSVRNVTPLYTAPPQRMNTQNELDDAMRTPRSMAQAYEAGWKAALAQLQQVGWMQKSTGVIRCDWGFDTTGYVPVYVAQEQSE